MAAVSAFVEALENSSVEINSVSLASNSMNDESMRVLLEGLKDRDLKKVVYHKNEMGNKAVQVIAQMLDSLEEVHFSHLKMDSMALNSFLEAVLENARKLIVLSLCKEFALCLASLKFDSKTVQLLCKVVKKNELVKLDISWNNLLQNQLSKILFSINERSKLADLNLSWNNMP